MRANCQTSKQIVWEKKQAIEVLTSNRPQFTVKLFVIWFLLYQRKVSFVIALMWIAGAQDRALLQLASASDMRFDGFFLRHLRNKCFHRLGAGIFSSSLFFHSRVQLNIIDGVFAVQYGLHSINSVEIFTFLSVSLTMQTKQCLRLRCTGNFSFKNRLEKICLSNNHFCS